ncbi:MAG: adenylate/guanylate cyclase domain-containing protein [Melioribacteraceae bacterium]
MPIKLDYSARARKMALSHPLLSDIFTQIIFWILAFSLYIFLVDLVSKAIASLFNPEATIHLSENIIIAIIGAIVFGTLLGLIDFYVERKLIRRSLGIEVLVKIFFYVVTWFVVVNIFRAIGFALDAKVIDESMVNYTPKFFSNMGLASSLYTSVMIVIISFIKQMNNKFGPGIILPMFLGKYRKPRVEERIFMFMDLKDSTANAEKLGHIKYSEMIQKCFLDVNKVLPSFNAEIYQYVGDEVVLTWLKDEGLYNMNCIKFYFAFQDKLLENKQEYESGFGAVPEFKASAHIGKITVAEVGNIKREIAYHGDTINIAARIQTKCNIYNKNFLISETLKNNLEMSSKIKIDFVDETILKGKTQKNKLYSVEL